MGLPINICDTDYNPLSGRFGSPLSTDKTQYKLDLDAGTKDYNPEAFLDSKCRKNDQSILNEEYTPPNPPSSKLNLQTEFKIEFSAAKYDMNQGWSDLFPKRATNRSECTSTNTDEKAALTVKQLAINGIHGFNTDVMRWNLELKEFVLNKETQQTPFYEYWLDMSAVGTLYKRVTLAIERAEEIENNNINHERVLSAVIAFFKAQVLFIFEDMDSLHSSDNFVSLHNKASSVYTRLEAIHACLEQLQLTTAADTGDMAIEPASVSLESVEILNAVFGISQMASKVCSKAESTLNYAVLCNNVLYPWIEELNFVIGLELKTIPRKFCHEFKKLYFPDMFIDLNDKTKECFLIKHAVPFFVPPTVSHLTIECYKLSSVLATGGHASALLRTEQPPIKWELEYEREDLRENLRENLREDLNTFGESESDFDCDVLRVPLLTHKKEEVLTKTPTEAELWRKLMVVKHQHQQLEFLVKETLYPELLAFRDVIVELYFLYDGCLWALMCEYIQDAFSVDPLKAVSALVKLESLVNRKFSDICFVFNPANHELFIQYEPPASIIQLFGGIKFVTRECQSVFNKVVDLHCTGKFAELTCYALTLHTRVNNIDKALKDPKVGISGVIAAFRNPC